MSFGGTADPCAQAEFNCIGKISKDENLSHSQALFSVINEVLGIPVDRYQNSNLPVIFGK